MTTPEEEALLPKTQRVRTPKVAKIYPKKRHQGRKLRDDARAEELDEEERFYHKEYQ